MTTLLKVTAERFCYLDVGQLVRHYFGLAKQTSAGRTHEGKRPVLLYLYWEPDDTDDQVACLRHRDEVEDFKQLVSDLDSLRRTHAPATLDELGEPRRPTAVAPPRHVSLLEERYGVAVG